MPVGKTSCLMDFLGDKANGEHQNISEPVNLKWGKSSCASIVKVKSSLRVCCLGKILKISDVFACRFDQDIAYLSRDKDSKSTNTSKKLAID